jgi:hypothetical protein
MNCMLSLLPRAVALLIGKRLIASFHRKQGVIQQGASSSAVTAQVQPYQRQRQLKVTDGLSSIIPTA